MDRTTVNQIQKEMLEAAQAVAAKHGVEVSRIRGTFDSTSLRSTIAFAAVSVDENGINTSSPEAVDYERYAHSFPFNIRAEVGIGHEIEMGRGKARIVGLKPRATKMPLLVQTEDGKKYKMAVPQSIKDVPRLSEAVMALVAAEGGLNTR